MSQHLLNLQDMTETRKTALSVSRKPPHQHTHTHTHIDPAM